MSHSIVCGSQPIARHVSSITIGEGSHLHVSPRSAQTLGLGFVFILEYSFVPSFIIPRVLRAANTSSSLPAARRAAAKARAFRGSERGRPARTLPAAFAASASRHRTALTCDDQTGG